MSRRLVLVFLVVLLGLVVAWFVQRSGGGPQNATAGPSIAASARDVDRSELERDGAAIRMREVAKPSAAPCDAGEGELCIDVVDTRGVPVSDAQVWWLDEESLARALADPVACMSGDPEQLYLQHGTPHATDEQGRAHVPKSEQRSIAYSRVEGRAGKVRIGPNESRPQWIELVPAADLYVRVVDEDGQGVPGAHVALRSSERGIIPFTRTVTSEPDGSAALGLAARYLVATPEESGLQIEVDGVTFVTPQFDRLNDREHPIVIAMPRPPSVQISVRVKTAAGEPARGTVELRRSETLPPPGTRRWVHGKEMSAFDAPEGATRSLPLESNGAALFRAVKRGGWLEARALLDDPPLELVLTAAGPARSGERLELVLPGPSTCVVRAQLVDESGETLEEGRSVTRIWCEDGVQRALGLHAGTNGEVAFAIDADSERSSPRSCSLETATSNVKDTSVFVALPSVLPQELQLGRIRMEASPVVLSGRVLDSDRNPIAGVPIVVDSEVGGWGLPYQADNLRPNAISDACGAFTVRGVALCSRIAVVAPLGLGPGASRDFDVGARDVELVVARGGCVEGHVDWGGKQRGIAPTDLEVVLVDPLRRYVLGWAAVDASGGYLVPYSPTGQQALLLRIRGGGLVGMVESIEVRAGERAVAPAPSVEPLRARLR